MPRPKYIICSQSRIIDKFSGLVSHINVLDELHAVKPAATMPPGAAIQPLTTLSLIAVWERSETDSDDELFELDVRMHVPGADIPRTLYVGDTSFGTSRNYRIDITVGLPAMNTGILLFESRFRRKGELDWLMQGYEIKIVVETTEAKQ